jgi:hypothetical protein
VKRLIATAVLLLMALAMASAQNEDTPYRGQGYFFVGLGPGTSSYLQSPLIVHGGGGGEGFLYKGLGLGAEAGYARWSIYPNSAWIASGDIS